MCDIAFNQKILLIYINVLEEGYATDFITVGLLLRETEDAFYYSKGGPQDESRGLN